MRLRPSHIAILVVVLLTAFVGWVAVRQTQEPSVPTSLVRGEDFIEGVRARADARPGGNERGTLPGTATGARFVPSIDLGMAVFDAGTVPNDEVTLFEVTVHNRGEGSLTITDVQTTCAACTRGRMLSDAPIPAGRTGTLQIAVDPFGIPGFDSTKTLTLYSNDPRQPRLSLDVTAQVEPEFALAPSEVTFGPVPAGSTPSQRLRFRSLQDTPIEVTGIEPMGEGGVRVRASIEEVPAEKWERPGFPEYDIAFTQREDAPLGDWVEFFSLANTTRRVPMLPIQVTGVVIPAEPGQGASS